MAVEIVIKLLGGLGVFIFGMKIMSESLEKAAGNNLKNLLSAVTSNRLIGIFTGFIITCIIQSSSATTVMIVGFVNAGLINLTQSIGIIMGANIGTTVTAWLVNLSQLAFGVKFKFDIVFISYIFVAIGVLFLFLKNKKINIWGYVLVGFAILFFGLNFLKDAIPKVEIIEGIKTNNFLLNFFQSFPENKFWSYIIFLLIGTFFTVILQSSSATMALTIMLVSKDYIFVGHALAMVLGENIGTTITANLAGLAGNRTSKKSAVAHTLFNLFGVAWVLPLFSIPGFIDLFSHFGAKGIQLAVFHSTFNITNTFLLIWFVPQIALIINKLFGKEKEKTKLVSKISYSLIKTPDLAVLEAQNEVASMAKLSYKIFEKTNFLISSDEKIQKSYDKIKDIEEELDIYEGEIYEFLIDLLKEDTSYETTDKINILMDEIRNLEWIGDSCEMIADLIIKAKDKGYEIEVCKDEQFVKIQIYLNNFFKLFIENINKLKNPKIVEEGLKFESKINALYKKMKKRSISEMKNAKKGIKKNVATGLLFMDIIKELEHIGDALKNILKSYNTYSN